MVGIYRYRMRKPIVRRLMMIQDAAKDLDLSTLPSVTGKTCIGLTQRSVEPAGLAYHKYCVRMSGDNSADLAKAKAQKAKKAKQAAELKNDQVRADWEAEQKAAGKLVAPGDEAEGEENLYESLELGHIGMAATEAQIKKAYQKMLLKYHPDKLAAEGVKDGENDPRFMRVQKAWTTLGNPALRRQYESNFDFDDAIPDGLEETSTDEDFLKVYGPVFERNARFSNKTPVPLLGDSETPIEEVRAFYAFWNRFESWREFTKLDEHTQEEIEGAESREEKRWMANKNKRGREKQKKKEYERIRLLVERAQKSDPRMVRHAEFLKAEKERIRQEKYLHKNAKAIAEKEAAEAAAKAKAELEAVKKTSDAEARKLRQNAKKAFKKLTKKLDKAVDAAYKVMQVSLDEREELDGKVLLLCEDQDNAVKVKTCAQAFAGVDDEEASEEERLAASQRGVATLRHFADPEKYELPDSVEMAAAPKAGLAAPAPKAAPVAAAAGDSAKPEVSEPEPALSSSSEVEWTAAEEALLAKACNKFPGGSRERWEQIAAYMASNAQPGGVERTSKQCIAKSQLLSKMGARGRATSTSSVGAADDSKWSTEQQTMLEAAIKKYPATMEKNERWAAIAGDVEGKSKKECAARFKGLREAVLAKQAKA